MDDFKKLLKKRKKKKKKKKKKGKKKGKKKWFDEYLSENWWMNRILYGGIWISKMYDCEESHTNKFNGVRNSWESYPVEPISNIR